MIPFAVYLKNQLEQVIHVDWRNFHSNLDLKNDMGKAELATFLEEARTIKKQVSSKKYLEPIKKEFIEQMDIIISNYNRNNAMEPNTNSDTPKLIWNGDISHLCDLFLQLAKYPIEKGTNAGKSLIGSHPEEFKLFIYNNFIQPNREPFDKGTIDRYIKGKHVSEKNKIKVSKLLDL